MKRLIILVAVICLSFVPADKVDKRFKTPAGYRAIATASGTFGDWLANLPLKPIGTHTLTYRVDVARTDGYTAAVIDMTVGSQDLQQCADAVMRLRAEYLYQRKQYQKISFNFTSGFRCDFSHFADGYRFVKDRWVKKASKDYSYESFMQYMKLVFSYAGTISLEKELVKANDAQPRAGDVFIHGGSPGHCFIVLKVCASKSGQRKFLLAQSFMPAQSIQILQEGGNPWFCLDKAANIPYGDLVANKYLRRFKD